jgi:hypothetical protein
MLFNRILPALRRREAGTGYLYSSVTYTLGFTLYINQNFEFVETVSTELTFSGVI